MDKNFLNQILMRAEEDKASDVHILTDMPPCFRINGDIVEYDNCDMFSAKNVLDLSLDIMDKVAQENFLEYLQCDFGYTNKESNTRYRVNVFRSFNGVSIAFRRLNSTIMKLEDVGFPEIFRKLVMLEKGLILICGPTGSGKSTTLASMIDYVNRNSKKHIITIEDPVEYIHKSNESIISQREVGRSVLSFAEGLRGALREDPDIILIGEMRDKETIKMALTAAETGHLVFGTLHTMSASKTIDRIIDSTDTGEKEVIRSMLSTSLQAIILQTLIKKEDNSGRIAAFEILIGTNGVRNLIRENKTHQIDSVIQTGSKYGMVTLRDYTIKLMEAGLIDKETALRRIAKVDEDKKE